MLEFLKNAIFRGLAILIPVVIIFITLRELIEIMIGFATPIADLFPKETFRDDDALEIIAALLIATTAFILGLLSMVGPSRALGSKFEDLTLNHVPLYRMLKSLIGAFLNMEGDNAFKPARLHHEDGRFEPVFVIEKHGDDMSVIMQPFSPTPFAGSISVVPNGRIEMVDASLDEYSLALTHFGLGLSNALQKK